MGLWVGILKYPWRKDCSETYKFFKKNSTLNINLYCVSLIVDDLFGLAHDHELTVEAISPSLVNIGVGTQWEKSVVVNARLVDGFTDSISEEAIEEWCSHDF